MRRSTRRWLRSKASNKNNTRLVCFSSVFVLGQLYSQSSTLCNNKMYNQSLPNSKQEYGTYRQSPISNQPESIEILFTAIKIMPRVRHPTSLWRPLFRYDKRLELVFFGTGFLFPVSKCREELGETHLLKANKACIQSDPRRQVAVLLKWLCLVYRT